MGNEKNTAASTPEMVTISRAEYEELKLQNQWLLEQLGLAKKRQFGASSERLQEGLMEQLSLMANEAEAYAYGTKNATAEQVAVKAHARSGRAAMCWISCRRAPLRKWWSTVFPKKSASVMPVVQSWRRLAKRCAGA